MRLRVQVPDKLSRQQREALEKYAALDGGADIRAGAVHVSDSTPKYMIGVAAELLGMHPQTLRMYEQRGLIRPRRTPGGTRLYSDDDLERVRRVTQLASGLGLSLQGAEYVRRRWRTRSRASARRIVTLEAKLVEAGRQSQRRVEEVHREYRRDLVLWQPPSTAIARRDR